MTPRSLATNTPGTTSDPLAQLADIHLPAPVASFPWAPGWWLLLILAVGTITLVSFLAWRRHRRRAWLRQALVELDALEAIDSNTALAQALNQLLRRVAIRCHGEYVAGLAGRNWQRFLTAHAGAQQDGEPWAQLDAACYRSETALSNRAEIIGHCRQWIVRQSRQRKTTGAEHV